jgi:hypothetical protein
LSSAAGIHKTESILSRLSRGSYSRRRKAKEQSDPTFRQDFLDCERRWLLLARGYELAVRIEALARGTPAVPVGQIKAAA